MVPVIVGVYSTVLYRYNLLVKKTYVAKVAMTTDYLILVPDRLLLRPPPAPQDFNDDNGLRLPYNNVKDGGIASSISVVQLQTMYWRIDGVSEHRFERSSTQNGRKLASKHLLFCHPSM